LTPGLDGDRTRPGCRVGRVLARSGSGIHDGRDRIHRGTGAGARAFFLSRAHGDPVPGSRVHSSWAGGQEEPAETQQDQRRGREHEAGLLCGHDQSSRSQCFQDGHRRRGRRTRRGRGRRRGPGLEARERGERGGPGQPAAAVGPIEAAPQALERRSNPRSHGGHREALALPDLPRAHPREEALQDDAAVRLLEAEDQFDHLAMELSALEDLIRRRIDPLGARDRSFPRLAGPLPPPPAPREVTEGGAEPGPRGPRVARRMAKGTRATSPGPGPRPRPDPGPGCAPGPASRACAAATPGVRWGPVAGRAWKTGRRT
jgi:hypothetical protein